MEKISEFIDDLTKLCNKHNVTLWTDPLQESIRLDLKGKGKTGEYKGKSYEYQYSIEYDEEKQEYRCYEWIPTNIQGQMVWDKERKK